MATMDDIARALGISKGTVSKALSGADDISEAMRKTVLEKAVEMGYSRISRTGTEQKLCVLIEHMAYEKPEDFGWDVIIGFRKIAEPTGFSVAVVPLNLELQKSMHYDEFMLRNDYKGALVLGIPLSDPWMQDFKSCRTPTVLLDNHISTNSFVTHIGIDNDEGMALAVSCLKNLGHRKIGYLSSALGSYVYQARYHAFFRALRKNKLEHQQSLAGVSFFISECSKKHLPRLLEQGCTAIICSHDLLAQDVMIHCGELGIKIPQHLSIIGFDDIPVCRSTTPPLSSIRQDRTELGKSGFYALSSQFNQVHMSTLMLHAELIQRESIGPVAAT